LSNSGICPGLRPCPAFQWTRAAVQCACSPFACAGPKIVALGDRTLIAAIRISRQGCPPTRSEQLIMNCRSRESPLISSCPPSRSVCVPPATDHAAPPALTGMSGELDRAITQGGCASVVATRCQRVRATPAPTPRPLLGLLLRSLSIRRSAAATRSRARSRSAMVYCRGSLARIAALGCFLAIVPLRLSRRIPPIKHIRRGFVSRVALILGVHGAEPTAARRRLRAEREA
jgi:hypothetical protein